MSDSKHLSNDVLLPVNDFHELEINEKIIQERESAIETLFEDTRNLNDMFKDLALLVQEQGEQVNLIEDNICSSENLTYKATTELEIADRRKKEKGCCCCCNSLCVIL